MIRNRDSRRRERRESRKLGPSLIRILAPGLYGAALLADFYVANRALRPAALLLLAAFIGYFLSRIHALIAKPRASEVERVELGLLAVLALSTGLQVTSPPPPWPTAVFGVLFVGLAASVPLPGILALPFATVVLWKPGIAWLAHLGHLQMVAATAGIVFLLEKRRGRRVQAALDKLHLDVAHLESRDASGRPVPKAELARLDDILYEYLGQIKVNAGAHGAVLAVKSHRGFLYVRELVSDSHNIREEGVFQLDAKVFHWILENRKPLRIGRLRTPSTRLGYYTGDVNVRSFLGVPVIDGDHAEGVLAVDSLRDDAFSDADLGMLRVASHQVATILNQIRELEQVRRRARDFECLHEFSKRLGVCDTIPELLNLLLFTVRERMQPDFSAVALLEPGGRMRIETVGESGSEHLRGERFGAKGGLAGWVLESRQYLHYQESRENARRPLFGRGVKAPDLQSIMLHPLVARDQSLGIVCIGAKAAKAFDSSSVTFCEIVAQQGAQGLLQIRNLEELEALATTDELTGLFNRRTFFERLTAEVARSQRYEHALALMLLDVDHFKKINDRYGHPAGDEVLRAIAQSLQRLARETDLVARYGGEEFAVLLPNTDAKGARPLAERVRRGIATLNVERNGEKIPVRASVGIAVLEGARDTVAAVVSRADQALYAAKDTGRNRVVLFSEIREPASCAT